MEGILFAKFNQDYKHTLSGFKARLILIIMLLSVWLAPCCLAHELPLGAMGNEVSDNRIPEIKDLSIINSNHRLLAYFSLRNGFTSQVVDALQSGIPVKYIFDVEVLAPGFLWRKQLVHREVLRVISFDSLKGEYRVMFGPVVNRVVILKTLDEAMRLVCDVNDVPLLPLKDLEKGTVYILRVRARSEKSVSSLPFEGLMKIFSSWGLETKWYEIRFSY